MVTVSPNLINLLLASFNLPSREKAGHDTRDSPRSRGNGKDCPRGDWYFGNERSAGTILAVSNTGIFTLTLQRLLLISPKITRCAGKMVTPFPLFTSLIGTIPDHGDQMMRLTLLQDYSTRIWCTPSNAGTVQGQRILEAKWVQWFSACLCPCQGSSHLLYYVCLDHVQLAETDTLALGHSFARLQIFWIKSSPAFPQLIHCFPV